MDRHDPQTRSRVMSRVRSAGTKLELAFEALLRDHLFPQFSVQASDLPGKPDILFITEKVAIFLDSCFWHGCEVHLRLPKSNVDYWKQKIDNNRRRDHRQTEALKALGWRVIRIWEHDINPPFSILDDLATSLSANMR